MKKLDCESLDLVRENIEKLKEIFPDVFTEDKIDFEKLRENLEEFVEESDEKYQFTWFGKKEANRLALTPTNTTLRPDKKTSKNWDSTKNVYIEGDNLEVLKVLQKAYYKKIKMIYIDPPYNTGKDFIYKDSYKDNLKNYLAMTGQIDEEGNPLTTNTEKSGRKHSNWLNMMYPRLKLARNLLRDDGVIFISIDDNEVHNLRKIMDEIFGEENFLYQLTVVNNLNGNDNSSGMMETHEYCLIYAKNKEKFEFGVLPIDDEKELEKWQIDEKGYYKEGGSLKATGINAPREKRPNLFFPIYINETILDFSLEKKDGYDYELLPITDGKEMSWYWSKEKFLKDKDEVIVKKTKDGYSLYKKQRPSLGDLPSKRGKTTFYSPSYSMANSNAYIKKLFNGIKMFDYPKPIELIKDFVRLANTKDKDIILDFFSGSATLADAVMQLNAEDGGNRQFILVQLPEPTDEKSEAYKAGYKNICEIGKERIRRAGEKIKEDYKDKEWIQTIDIGFKVFKLDSTNIIDCDSDAENLRNNIFNHEKIIKPDRSEEDLLYEVLLKYGIDLTAPIQEKEINGKKIYIVGFGSLIVYFDEIDIEIAKEIVNLVKEYESDFCVLVLKDDGFETSKDKVNIVEFFKQMNLFEKIITL